MRDKLKEYLLAEYRHSYYNLCRSNEKIDAFTEVRFLRNHGRLSEVKRMISHFYGQELDHITDRIQHEVDDVIKAKYHSEENEYERRK